MIFVMVRIQLLDQFIADFNILGTEENIASAGHLVLRF